MALTTPQRSSFYPCAAGGSTARYSYTSYTTTPALTPTSNSSPSSSVSSPASCSPEFIMDPSGAEYSHQPSNTTTTPTKKRGRRRTKVVDPHHIPRPPNSFIQFRRYWVKEQQELQKNSINSVSIDSPKSLSKLAGEAWRRLTTKERAAWQRQAIEAKEDHMERHPDYKFRPRKRGATTKRETGRFLFPNEAVDGSRVPSVTHPLDQFSDNGSSSNENGSVYVSSSRGSSVVDFSYPSPSCDSLPIQTPPQPISPQAFPSVSKDDTTPTEADFLHTPMQQAALPDQLLQAPYEFVAPSIIPYDRFDLPDNHHHQHPDAHYFMTQEQQPLDQVPPPSANSNDSYSPYNTTISLNDIDISDYFNSFPADPVPSSGFFTDAERRAFGMDMIDSASYHHQPLSPSHEFHESRPLRLIADQIGAAFTSSGSDGNYGQW